MEQDKIFEYMMKKGVKNPEEPSEKEIRKLLGMMYNSDNELEKDFFKGYFNSMSSVGKAVIDGLKSLANSHVSKEYINSINKVIDQLNKDYEQAKSEEEKEKVYYRIIEQLDRIKQESREMRDFLKQLGLYGAGTAIIIGGAAVAVRNKELGKQIVNNGLEAFKARRE
jgi:hypothetical protein